LISFNDSIDFVQQIHWFCSTIPMDLFPPSAAFASPIRRFHYFILTFLPESAGSLARCNYDA